MRETSQALTEASSSKFAGINEGDLELNIHYNDCGQGAETVVMLHGSGPGASGGPTSTATSSHWSRPAIG